MKVGLRFLGRDAPLLHHLAHRVRGGELGEQAAQTFEQAGLAAETGEPLLVLCKDADEAVRLADGYVLYGISRPAIEQLSGA